MDSPADLIEELYAPDEQPDTLSASDEVYLTFRQAVEPGLFSANFDLTPGKSAAFRNSRTGERMVDQTLRGHILNGAAFGARLNHALRQHNSPAALSDTELLEVLAMHACHDLHKSEDAQRRRAVDNTRYDSDKDIPDEELEYYINTLNLGPDSPLEIDVSFDDYKAAALRTEVKAGRHRTATGSMRFSAYSDWLRLLDSAASISKPEGVESLDNRLKNIDGTLTFTYQKIDDTKGITTNLLNHAITEYITENTDCEPVVYFQNAVVFLTTENTDLHTEIVGRDVQDTLDKLVGTYQDTIQQEVASSTGLEQVKNALSPVWAKGFIGVGKSVYLLYGLEKADEAVRSLVTGKTGYDDWKAYPAYKSGVLAAMDSTTVSDLPDTHHTAQALGVYISTVWNELFRRLHNNDRKEATRTAAAALGIGDVEDVLEPAFEEKYWEYTPSPDQKTVEVVAEHIGETPEQIHGRIEDGVRLNSSKCFGYLLALAYLNTQDETGVPRMELAPETVLQQASDDLLRALETWDSEWDARLRGEWDSERPRKEKVTAFKQRLMGPFAPATRDYIAHNVSLEGTQIAERQTSKNKLEEYNKETQPHICQLCNDLLVGGTSLKRDFRTTEKLVGVPLGFSHTCTISTTDKQPTPVVCAQCDLETTLRNSIHSLDQSTQSNYLFLAPDYYYSPADMAIERTIRTHLRSDNGFTILQVAREIISGNPDERSESVEHILSAFKTTGEYTEYKEFIHNYDTAVGDVNTMGVFRLEPPIELRKNKNTDTHDARIARWLFDALFAIVVSWATSSRVLVTPSPLPTTSFEDFPEMVYFEQIPGPVKDFIGGETVSISNNRDLGKEPDAYVFNNLTAPETTHQATAETTAQPVTTDGGSQPQLIELNTSMGDTPAVTEDGSLVLQTELATALYRLSALFELTRRRFGMDFRRIMVTLEKSQKAFAGASLMLKGNTCDCSYSALSAASVLDTLSNYEENRYVTDLAGIADAFHPPTPGNNSNYNYEVLFRIAADVVKQATASSDTDIIQQAIEQRLRETAKARQTVPGVVDVQTGSERFAETFMEMYNNLHQSDPYLFRHAEHDLASGYNAAARRVAIRSKTTPQ